MANRFNARSQESSPENRPNPKYFAAPYITYVHYMEQKIMASTLPKYAKRDVLAPRPVWSF